MSSMTLCFLWVLHLFFSFLKYWNSSAFWPDSTCLPFYMLLFGNFRLLPYSVPVHVLITPKLCISLENFIKLKIHISKDTSTWMYDSQQDNRSKISLSKRLHPQRDLCLYCAKHIVPLLVPNTLNSISSHPKYRYHLWLLSPHPSQQILTTDFLPNYLSNWST